MTTRRSGSGQPAPEESLMPDTTPTLRDRIAAALWPLTDWDGDECNAVAAADAVLAVLPEPPARLVLGTTDQQQAPCGCSHPVDEHSIYGCADDCGCEWMLPKARNPLEGATDQQPATAPAGDLRSNVLEAIRRALAPTGPWGPEMDTATDAVLAVLPATVDRAAEVCICGHTEAQHFEDCCQVCDCGMCLVPEAARELITRLHTAVLQLRTERTELGRQLDCLRGDMRDMEAHVREQGAEFERLRRMADGAQQPTGCTSAPCLHPGDCGHGCRAAADELSRETQQPEAPAPQCTAGLLPATDAAVDRCIRRGKHDSHATAAGVLWGNGSDDEQPEDGEKRFAVCEFVPDTPRAPDLCATCGDSRAWHNRTTAPAADQPDTETEAAPVVAWSSVGSLFCTSCCDGHPDYRAARVTALPRGGTCDGCGSDIPATTAP